jgi:tRNA(Ile)-lysidine synthetase-like protein
MLELAAGWELHVERTAPGRGAVTSEEVPALGRLTAVFDGLAMERALALRPPQVGDRLSPTGMDGTVKLSDLFINRKIPRAIRHRWPVVEGGGEVLWVAGLRQSRAHPITASSRAILRLSLRKAVSE